MLDSDLRALFGRRHRLIAGVILVAAGTHAAFLGSRPRRASEDATPRLRARAAAGKVIP